MPISPWRVGQTSPAWLITVTDDTGAAVNLTGISAGSFVLTIYDSVSNSARAGVGTFTVVNASAGQIQYQWANADVASADTYTLTVSWPTGTGTEYTDAVPWVVKPVGVL